MNQFNIHDESLNTASNQPSVLNSDINEPTEDITNTPHNEIGMHNESVLIVDDQPSVSNADLVNSCKFIEATKLNKASNDEPTTDEFNNSVSRLATVRFNGTSSKRPKLLTPCPLLRKRGFCKKGNGCDFLHQKRQFHNMQTSFHCPLSL